MKIKKLVDKGLAFYPATISSAVKDPNFLKEDDTPMTQGEINLYLNDIATNLVTKQELSEVEEVTANALIDLNERLENMGPNGQVLSPGDNITIENNTISATCPIDSDLDIETADNLHAAGALATAQKLQELEDKIGTVNPGTNSPSTQNNQFTIVSESGFFVVDDSGNIGLKYDQDGLDAAILSENLISKFANIVNAQLDNSNYVEYNIK